MADENVLLLIENGVASVRLNREERRNALDIDTATLMYEHMKNISNDNSVRVVVLEAAGSVFCSGGDVREMCDAADRPKYLRELSRLIHWSIIEMRTMKKPVVAVVNGYAGGAGLGLVMAADIAIAGTAAKFNTAFMNIGAPPGCGTYFLPRIVGYKRACELVFTAQTFNAEEALEMGFVNRVVPQEELEAAKTDLISKLSKGPTLAMGLAKELLHASLSNQFQTQLDLESKAISIAAGTKDFEEGVSAFTEKRKADFKGS
ncbi:MAG: enoyl-CoA hydratase/isomerase family protein [Thermoplasmata archaeon]|nr:MAG: enoyl-CoA hydratase/isomerase family protein [Thermoplasmata archaeon]